MKKIFFTSVMLLLGGSAIAQGFLNKLKQKAENMANKTLENVIDGKASKSKEASVQSTAPGEDSEHQENEAVGKKTALSSTTTYDFIPGSKVLLADDFSQDAQGQFPLKWYTRSKGEIVTLNNAKGK
ncbi:MAG: hypothetical protein ACN6PN_03040, partial [Sphingobacterium sp.]